MSHADNDPERDAPDPAPPAGPLRRGWTTGSCATAATRAAYQLLLTGECPAAVDIALPNGTRPTFAVATSRRSGDAATAGIIKDAGDDPDVTHGALVEATVRFGAAGSGVAFRAGPGVGTVTKPGLPIPPGEPAINPVPRAMMRQTVAEAAAALGGPADVAIEIAIPGGEALAAQTLNGRLGIVGGLSILGTTGIVVPYSCAAWIDSIHRGIDVARATGLTHVAGATGATSEAAVRALHRLPDGALLEMGNFAGGLLKYLRRHPVHRLTIAGGVAKMAKLGQGLLDLHSKRGSVDKDFLLSLVPDGATDLRIAIADSLTADAAVQIATNAGLPLGDALAAAARRTADDVLDGTGISVDVVVVARDGTIVGRG